MAKCNYCERIVPNVTKDHIVPISKGGSNLPCNIIKVCRDCNVWKNNIYLRDWRNIVYSFFTSNTRYNDYTFIHLQNILCNTARIKYRRRCFTHTIYYELYLTS